MKKLFFTIIVLLSVGGGTFWWFQQKVEQKTPQEVFHHAALNIHTRWSKGDDEGKWREGKLTCQGILGIPEDTHPNYLRCNPNFLYCWYRYHKEEILHKLKRYSFKVHFPAGERLPFTRRMGALLVEIEGHGEKFKISLLDTCNETLLPEGYYGYGQYSSSQEDWRWDNMERNIFVDKFLVSFRDIWEWGGLEQKRKVDFSSFPSPATNITSKEMEGYCAWKGKQLMESHIFDAAAFHPGDVNNRTPPVNIRGNYPWTSERMSLEESENFSMGICLRLLDKECFEREGHQNFSSRSISWTGMNQVLGGVLEFQRNPLHPNKNLVLSSYYYPYYSPANQLGKRGRWNGKRHFFPDFNFRGHSPEKKDSYKVGFRCMREVGKMTPIPLDTPSSNFSYTAQLNYDSKSGGKILSEPKGIWHRILQAEDRCLFYKTPFKKGGEIRLGNNCSNPYSNQLLYSEVKNFKVEYGSSQTVLTFETHKSHRMEFIHFNMQQDSPWERYDPPVSKSYRTGLLMGGWPLEMEKKGKLEDNYKNDSAQPCHRVNRNCEDILEYSCDRCRHGFFEVLDFKCPQGGSKYCGQNRCGELGQPACLRGYLANQVQGSSCIDDWEAGFCQEGLRQICDTNGILICSH